MKGLSFLVVNIRMVLLFSVAFVLAACGGSSDTETESYVKFYNASPDSPSIFMTLDENLEDDETDEYENTFAAVAFGSALSRNSIDKGDYFIELAWQDEDSSARTDLEIVYEDQVQIVADATHWVVLSGSILDPVVNMYSIPLIDEDDQQNDIDNDLLNIRLVNLNTSYPQIDVYLSKDDETFNEATFVTSLSSMNLTENYKISEDQYKLYFTEPGSDSLIFTSEDLNYAYSGQYLLAIRDNSGVGGSAFVVDSISSSTITHYDAVDSQANLKIYNGLGANTLLSNYDQAIDMTLNGGDFTQSFDEFDFGTFTDTLDLSSGDYRLSITNDADDSVLLQNRLVSLPQNTNQTVFLYWTTENVDADGDGNVDENEDGVVDEVRPLVASIVVSNHDLSSIYAKQITLVHMADNDDFSNVTFYFVKSDEIIATSSNQRNISSGKSSSIVLQNNTYDVFVTADIDNNEIILDELSVTLDVDSSDLFIMLEPSSASGSGYAMRIAEQN